MVVIWVKKIAVPYGNGDASVPEQRYRDVLKTVMTDAEVIRVITNSKLKYQKGQVSVDMYAALK